MAQPAYIDAPLSPALRREVLLTKLVEQRFARALMRIDVGLFSARVKSDLLKASKRFVVGERTLDQVVEVVPWYNEADPETEKLWAMLQSLLNKVYSEVVEAAGQGEMKALGLPVKFTLNKAVAVALNPYSVAWVRDKSASLVKYLSDEKRELLRALLLEGFESGLRPEAMLEEIYQLVGLTPTSAAAVKKRSALLAESGMAAKARKKSVARYARKLGLSRAHSIARTETIDAYTQGLTDSWQMAREQGHISPQAKKDWVEIAASKKTCKICRALGEHEPVLLDQPFNSDVVGAVQRPPAHPGCRCTITLEDA